MIDFIFKSSAILVAFYLVYRFLLSKETFTNLNRAFLLLGIMVSILLPLWEIERIETVSIKTQDLNPTVSNNGQEFPMKGTTENSSWQFWLISIYCTVTATLISRQLIGIFTFLRRIKKEMKTKVNGLFMVTSIEYKTPFSFFKYIVYDKSQFNSEELRHILAHETIHSKQWHSLDLLIAQLYCAIFWINPISYLYKKCIEQNLEYIADQVANNKAESAYSYQRTMLKTSIANLDTGLLIGNHFYNSLLHKRITHLNRNKSKSFNIMKTIFIVPILAFLTIIFNQKIVGQVAEVPIGYHSKSPDMSIEKQIQLLLKASNEYDKSSQLLYLLDGVLVPKRQLGALTNDKIQSIVLFKKDQAKAIYGEVAAKNGVISFTSRKSAIIEKQIQIIGYADEEIENSETKDLEKDIKIIGYADEEPKSVVSIRKRKEISSQNQTDNSIEHVVVSTENDEKLSSSDKHIIVINGEANKQIALENLDASKIKMIQVFKGKAADDAK